MKTHLVSALITVAMLCALAFSQQAQDGERSDLRFCNLDKNGLAIDGYDPVAYFPEAGSSPKKGKQELSHSYRGVTYRFASAENLERFKQTPARYEAAYGGWCAYAMADGKQVEVDPESYLIQDERLMLFYKSIFNDTRKKWSKQAEKLQAEADARWEKLTGARRRLELYNLADGALALAGFDAVSYFGDGPRRGDEAHKVRRVGIVYRFASDENEQAFRADPSRYMPAYGGWCAWAMSQGERVDVDPTVFSLEDGRLLLFKDQAARKAWAEDPKARSRARRQWAAMQ